MIIVLQRVTPTLVSTRNNADVAIAIGIKQKVLETRASARNLIVRAHVLVTQASNVVVLVDTRQTEWVFMKLKLQQLLPPPPQFQPPPQSQQSHALQPGALSRLVVVRIAIIATVVEGKILAYCWIF